jgi:hypothetical protein
MLLLPQASQTDKAQQPYPTVIMVWFGIGLP